MVAYQKDSQSVIDLIPLVEDYINCSDWRVKEDSNRGYSLHGLSTHIANTVQAKFWLEKIYPKEIGDAHKQAVFHIHDLGLLSGYCNGWDLRDLLVTGYTGTPGVVSFAPAKHFDSAINQLVNFMYTLRHEAPGAQAISSLDTYLAPFIREDGLTYEEVKQGAQEFVYNMNIPIDKGFQAPFSNITLDIKPAGELAEENVVIGGEIQNTKYKEYQEEINMFNRALAEVYTEGDAQGQIFTWPIPTYNLTKDFPWDEDYLQPIWEMTAKFGVPYFANFINSDMEPDDVRSMCCRLRIDNRELRKRGGGLFGSNPLTGSIGVVTLNLPRIGYEAKDPKDFLRRLGQVMDLAKRSLVIKREFIEETTERGLYPYNKFYLRDVHKRFGEYWKNHFNTIGITGMNEACMNLFGPDKDITSEAGRSFTMEMMDFMRNKLVEYQEETDQIFNLEASPAESATFRMATIDRRQYPDIIVANNEAVNKDGAAPFYTNSTQLPVNATDDIFEALDHQDEIQCKYTGGTVQHIFLGERMSSGEETKKLVRSIAENYRLPYFSITPTFSICPKHGYLSGEHEYCPKCDKEIGYVDTSKSAARK